MFRLTAYGDQPELYRYLSSIASTSICQALDDWFGIPYELEEDAEWTAESVHRVNRMSMDDAEEAGYQLPLWLVGTEAAFDAREESLRERLKDLQDQIDPEQDLPKPE